MARLCAVGNRVQIRKPTDTSGSVNAVIFCGSGSPTDGAGSTATGRGFAGYGSIYINVGRCIDGTKSPLLYVQSGTSENAVRWVAVGTSTGYWNA